MEYMKILSFKFCLNVVYESLCLFNYCMSNDVDQVNRSTTFGPKRK